MRPAPALARWLDDEEAQARSATASARAAHQQTCEPLRSLRRELDMAESLQRCPRAAGLALASVHRLLEGDEWLVVLIERMGDQLRADPFFEPPFAPIAGAVHRGLLLLDHPLASVAVLAISADAVADKRNGSGRKTVSFGGLTVVTRVVRANGLRARCYEADDPGEDFRLASAAPCRLGSSTMVAAGTILTADGRTRTFTLEPTRGDALVVRVELKSPEATLRRDYHAETGACLGFGMVDQAPARTQLMLSLLRAAGRVDAAALFAGIIARAPFFMRWYAMREMLALDPDAAIPLLDRMADGDPHAEVREAATVTRDDLARRFPAVFGAARDRARSTASLSRRLPCPA